MNDYSLSTLSKLVFFSLLVSIVAIASRNVVVCRICVLLILGLCIYLGRREPKFFNPFFLFALTPFSLLIYTNLSDSIMMDLNHDTWVIAIINMFAFIVAVYYSIIHTKDGRMHEGQTADNLGNHALLLIFLYSVASLYQLITSKTLAVSSVFLVCGIPAIICALKSRKILIILFVVAVYFLLALDTMSKASILRIAVTIMIGYEMLYPSTKMQRRVIYILTGASVVLLVASFAFGLKGKEHTSAQERKEKYEASFGMTWDSSAELIGPYAYMTTPWTNLQYVMETQGNEHTDGLWLVRPVLGYLQIDEKYKKEYTLIPYSSFNTYTFIGVQYKDFGLYLSIISSILIGLFVGRYYRRCLTTNSPLEIANYVLTAQATLMMFFSNHFFMMSYPFTIVLAMWIYKNIFGYRI